MVSPLVIAASDTARLLFLVPSFPAPFMPLSHGPAKCHNSDISQKEKKRWIFPARSVVSLSKNEKNIRGVMSPISSSLPLRVCVHNSSSREDGLAAVPNTPLLLLLRTQFERPRRWQ